MMQVLRIFGLILSCLAAISLAAVSLAADLISPGTEPEYRITRFTAENGLPQNSVKAMAQTPDGYLWVGTLYGLARFDGVHFKVYDQSNTPEMRHDSINALAVDERDGSLWIGTGRDLLQYKNRLFQRLDVGLPPAGGIGVLRAASRGGVWFSPENGKVARFREDKIQTWTLNTVPDKSGTSVGSIYESGPNQLVVRAGRGLYKLDLSRDQNEEVNLPGIKGNQCLTCAVDSRDILWVNALDGLWMLEAERWTLVSAQLHGFSAPVGGIFSVPNGEIYVSLTESSKASFFRVEGAHLEPVSVPDWHPSEISGVVRDLEGNLWIGTSDGLFRLESKGIKVYADGLASTDVRGLTVGAEDTIWVTTTRGVSAIRAGRIKNIPTREAAPDWNSVSVLMADHVNRVWLPYSFSTLRIIENDEWTAYEPAPDESWYPCLSGIKSLYEDRRRRIWIGTHQGLIYEENGSWKTCLTNAPPDNCDVRVIHEDRSGDMWFGTFGSGLYRFHDGAIASFKTTLGEYNNRAWCIHEDVKGFLWIGSQNGLNRFIPPGHESADGTFFTFTTKNGLRENTINNIQEDNFGNLWLSGLRGIYQISRADLNDVAAGVKKRVQCIAYGEADGMLSSECNGGDNQPAGGKDQEGRIWFPTVNGVVMIDPNRIRKNEVPPPVVIEQVVADGQIVFGDDLAHGLRKDASIITGDQGHATSDATRLEPGRARVLEFHYAANTFIAPEKVRFKYMLEGDDSDWRGSESNEHVAHYTNLRPGDYRFRVKACNSHGVWNETGVSFAFSIAPKFTQTIWFPMSCALGLLAVSGGLAVWRLHWQRRIYLEQQRGAVEAERGRIARNLHDDLSASLSGLALELEAARRKGSADGNQLETLAAVARTLALNLREVAWTTNPRCDSVGNLGAFFGETTERFCLVAGLEFQLELPPDTHAGRISATLRHELLMVLKESLNNIGKHAQAHRVILGCSVEMDLLRLTISDDGRSFNSALPTRGNGLKNLRERVESIGGRFDIVSTARVGTTIRVEVNVIQTEASR
jgi:ligand-binding sensor domain-containing protein/signal transduction histidine kinase